MSALIAAGLPVASSCDGDGICSMCRVRVTSESGSAPGDAINSPASFETDSLKRNKCAPDERLSCQIEVRGDITVKTKYW